jgi:hypothetical protein
MTNQTSAEFLGIKNMKTTQVFDRVLKIAKVSRQE